MSDFDDENAYDTYDTEGQGDSFDDDGTAYSSHSSVFDDSGTPSDVTIFTAPDPAFDEFESQEYATRDTVVTVEDYDDGDDEVNDYDGISPVFVESNSRITTISIDSIGGELGDIIRNALSMNLGQRRFGECEVLDDGVEEFSDVNGLNDDDDATYGDGRRTGDHFDVFDPEEEEL